jgi:IS1 family transposase/transposase-like protein
MIQVTMTYKCRACGSENIVKNGRNKAGNAQYHCKDCGAYRVLVPKSAEQPERRRQVLQAYRERASLRGLGRIFGVARQSVLKWLADQVEQLPSLVESLLPKQAGDILELDELWAFVYQRDNERWLWTALCRRTRQIVAFVIGDRSAATCRRLWQAIPPAYRRCRTYTDFWKSYQAVLPKRTHHPVGKETGQTAHQERWYLTLRQRVSRFVRKTLSFSKSERNHELVTRWFIVQYNLSTSPIWVESECLKRYKR